MSKFIFGFISGEMLFYQDCICIVNQIFILSRAGAFSKNPCSSPETERSFNTLSESAQ